MRENRPFVKENYLEHTDNFSYKAGEKIDIKSYLNVCSLRSITKTEQVEEFNNKSEAI